MNIFEGMGLSFLAGISISMLVLPFVFGIERSNFRDLLTILGTIGTLQTIIFVWFDYSPKLGADADKAHKKESVK